MRTILHLDLDAFFCAVEELHNPSLRGKPFAVGGRPEERGVVASCSYSARQRGVRSAMPMGRALRLCPDMIVVPTRHNEYGAVSKQVMARLHALTPLVEQISIDEAWLDVTSGGPIEGPGEATARALQQQIRDELRLPCSIGVASNKLVAKIANNIGKAAARGSGPPNAITVVRAGAEAAFLAPLAVEELRGVGPRTAQLLHEFGIATIGDLASTSEADLVREFGRNGATLWLHAHGRDDSPIVVDHERKSVSQETTFVRDVSDAELLRATLFAQAKDVALTLDRMQLACGGVRIKLRWADFTTITRQSRLQAPSASAQEIFEAATRLFDRAWDGRPVRLIGVGATALTSALAQPTLFDAPDPRRERLEETLREVRARYGKDAVKKAGER